EAWRPVLGYVYPWHPWRLGLILGLTGLAAWLLPLALAARWQRLWPARWLLPLAGLSLLLLAWAGPGYSYDIAGYGAHVLGLLAATVLCWRSRRQEPAMVWPLLATLLCSLTLALLWPGAFLDGFYFLALALLMSLLLLGHASGLMRLSEQAARNEAQRAALQTRLLRNSMQPHWLMNTLTSLQELIETEPARASRMVDLLADEFVQLRRLGDAPLITLEQELALCRAHLRVLALLRGHEISLQVDGQADGIWLPPGLLHTLVENALTHGAALHRQPSFHLVIDEAEAGLVLRFQAPQGPGRSSADGTPRGAGRHFIEASLAAAFPGRWQFSDGPDGQGHWCSQLRLPHSPGKVA
ncbi:histidine kinase, partial [Ideonella sp.]|uniref:histidine kinase n=1 Tax=Ideonella sp. TaxID=1929293 RepID=UPI003BB7DE0D